MEKIGRLINNLQELYTNQASGEKLAAVANEILTILNITDSNIHSNNKVSVILPAYYPSRQYTEVNEEPRMVVIETPMPIAVEVKEPVVAVAQEPVKVIEPIAQVVETVKEVTPVAVVTETKPLIEKPINIYHQEMKEVFKPFIPASLFTDTIAVKPAEPVEAVNETPILPFKTALKNVPTISVNEKEEKVVFELKDTLTNDEETINDKLKEEKKEINHNIPLEPVKDIKKAFNINEKYVFINELFRGDDAMFERSLKTINAFHIYPEAQYWIQRELKVKLGWNENSSTVQLFDTLVKRRFAS